MTASVIYVEKDKYMKFMHFCENVVVKCAVNYVFFNGTLVS